jgi:DNA-binding HxlR family transcriptional regulator
MKQRTYNQYCPIAHTLDLVGDRWALLILRDLLLGPKRFSDLLGGLPGIGTNILTDRLKGLEQAAIVQRRMLPPPAASAVYELTPRGRELEGPLMALAQWGGATLGTLQPDQCISRDSVRLTARALIRRLSAGQPGTYSVVVNEPHFIDRIGFRVADEQVQLDEALLPPAELTLTLDVNTLFALVGGHTTLAEAIASGAAQLMGTEERLAALGTN